ncbi:MerR family transcriptional regulator [Streptomyces catenulae]|uniref:MerR family transcriptional regulator n=1 Tax=Streptomyces catenulae TaxID=66875 RepID=A0ABV2YVJ3_9ACTN|nr:MerR family transcriptional regulator [Streptomyces catenulae]
MRLSELSEHSGVSTATIKYYLREQLLPQGRRITATRSEYDASHLRRLRLIRALIQVGKVPVATVREVLAAVDDESLGRTNRLGAALWALPRGPEADPDAPATQAAGKLVEELLTELGWDFARTNGALSPAYRSLVAPLARLLELGYPVTVAELLPYARQMASVAGHDFDALEKLPDDAERAETAVSAAILREPVLLALRRVAQEEESARRYGV